MNIDFNQSDQEKKKAYKVPEGYFENLTEQIMNQLPQKGTPKKTVSFIQRLRPWIYAAAIFIGIISIYTILMNNNPQSSSTTNSSLVVQSNAYSPNFSKSAEENEEYLEYLESKYTNAIFSDELSNNIE